ncbi:MAG: Rab family GTPase [Anaerolineae bacterium]
MSSIQKKICLLGDFAVGKTSLVRRFVEGVFDEKYLSTIGAHVSRKVLAVRGVPLTLLVWDLAGEEKFTRVMHSYYRGAAGAILVCDLTRAETFPSLKAHAQAFWSVCPHTPVIVVGNKVDLLEQRVITDAELAEVAAQLNAFWLTSSAKTAENVQELFEQLGGQLLAQPN